MGDIEMVAYALIIKRKRMGGMAKVLRARGRNPEGCRRNRPNCVGDRAVGESSAHQGARFRFDDYFSNY